MASPPDRFGRVILRAMFTGIIQAVGRIQTRQVHSQGVRLLIDSRGWDPGAAPGDSICVQGCCLTFAPGDADPAGLLGFDVVPETLSRTSLGRLEVGHRVNLEASLTPSTPMGGHFVQGHVEGLGKVIAVDQSDGYRLRVQLDAELTSCVIPKGSIAIEGVSLTVASVEPKSNQFDVALIPTTLAHTTLGELKAGDPVNLETDMLVRAVVHVMQMNRTPSA